MKIKTTTTEARCAAALRFATKYPLISESSIAKELGWTAKKLEEEFQKRGYEMPNAGFRPQSLQQVIKVAARLKDGKETLKRFLKDLETLRYTGQTGKLRV